MLAMRFIDFLSYKSFSMKMTWSPMSTMFCGVSLLFTVGFAASTKRALDTQMQNLLHAKKQTAITCIPNDVNGDGYTKRTDANTKNKNNRGHKDNGNGCSHQNTAGALCSSGSPKRRLKTAAR